MWYFATPHANVNVRHNELDHEKLHKNEQLAKNLEEAGLKIFKGNQKIMDLIENIKKEAKTFFSKAKGSHDWTHTERVYNLCMRIGKKESADMEIVRLAAILHDIARGEEDESNGTVCHAERGAVLARQLLAEYNIDPGKIDKITHCIKCHRFRTNTYPRSKEAQILSDADKLDAIGAVGVGRAFLFAGEIGAKLHNNDIDVLNTNPYTKEDTAYREFVVKLSKIRERMLTKEGKRIAEERHRFMADFFNRFNQEAIGDL